MLPSYAAVTLAEFKADAVLSGTAQDALAERSIQRATLKVEAALGRRLVFRAPVEAAADTVAAVSLANGSLTIAAQPSSEGRCFAVSLTAGTTPITAGTLTITGTVGGVVATAETFDLSLGCSRIFGVKFFTALSSIAVAGLAGGAGATVSVGTSLGYVEYHTPAGSEPSLIWAMEYPVVNVCSLHEDSNWEYTSDDLLTLSTDYLVAKGQGSIRRVSGAAFTSWTSTARGVKLRYSGGYATSAEVPASIKDEILRLAVRIFREAVQGRQDVSSVSDATGNSTRFGPSTLTSQQRLDLAAHARFGGHPTGERDFDLEAA